MGFVLGAGTKLKKESSFSEEKEAKRLLQIARRTGPKWENSLLPETDRSFLLLFFKKEDLYLRGSRDSAVPARPAVMAWAY